MNIEQQLREALRRKPAPEDFADRVLARIAADAARSTQPKSGPGALRWLAAAAVLALTVGAGERYYTHQRQVAEAARVQQEIRLALQITSEKLALVQQKMQRPVDGQGR